MEHTMLNTSQQTSGTTSQFSFELLKRITNNFSEDRVIGHGAYGVVYKGVLDSGEEIAVKKLIYRPPDHVSQKQFHNECTNLMRVQHKNIVRLVGYCHETRLQYIEKGEIFVPAEENERALCFEFLEGGSLDTHVSNEPCRLDWDMCYKIIKGVCEGLNHLHNGYKYSIFHLDLKPANILLDNNMIPKIGDFGLSRIVSTTKTCTTATALGTMGYTPPECIDKQEISPKFDVFSLGVVIIHIMAGRKHYYDHVHNPSKIIELVRENWGKRVHATMWQHASKEVTTCIKIALRCVNFERHERPTISKIVEDLNRIDIARLSLTCEGTSLERRETMVGVHDNAIRFDSMEGINYITAVSNEVRGNDNSMHDPMDYLHEPIMRDSASTSVSEPRDVTQTIKVDTLDDRRRNPHLRAVHTRVTMDTIGIFFQWARSTISSQWSSTEGKRLHHELFCLEKGLQYLMDALPDLYALSDRAEWRSHKSPVDKLLPNFRDALYDADDFLDEFRWYMLNVEVEGIGSQSLLRDFFSNVSSQSLLRDFFSNVSSQSLLMDFFINISKGNFTKSVNGIRERLDNISTRLLKVGLHEVETRFDKTVRPETSSFPNDEDFIGRDMELKKIIEFLCKPRSSSSANPKRRKINSAVDVSTSTPSSNQVSSESSLTDLTVLPIVGIGGVGKTTLAQHICSKVKSDFDLIIWVCVSDDFDVKRLTKEAIESGTGKQATTENLTFLQNILLEIAVSKRFLLVLDDMWDDVLKDNGKSWKTFCAPLTNVLHGSVVLVTTRCQKVADRVGTMDPITLEGLEDDVFWNFFRLCVFGSGSSNNNYPELECIGISIVQKLKGSPLAAKTLGRILRMNLQAEYWNTILESELWTLKQEDTEILPALRLSYMYLPFHLKRCFALCALYQKDYKFQRDYLAEIWVAEGFVEPEGDIPVQDIGRQYFNDLLYRSFFQEVQGEYVIHDLLHDMAQKVSEFDCFIVKRKIDFKNIPPNVRHLSILSSKDIGYSNLMDLRCFTKLRTLLCNKHLANKATPPSLVATWCSEFPRLRVIVFATTHELPPSIGNLKHLRYLQISKACPFKSLPIEFCWLYNLQIVCVKKCKLESLPADFSKLICLQRFESHGFCCDSMSRRSKKEELYEVRVDGSNDEQGVGFKLIKNINQLGELVIRNIGKPISKEHAAEAQLQSKKYLENLDIELSLSRNPEDNDIDVLKILQPPTCLNSFRLRGYLGVSLPRWFQPQDFPSLMSPSDELESSSVPRIIRGIGGVKALSCLTSLILEDCIKLSTIDDFLAEEYLPAIERIHVTRCHELVSLPGERFGNFSSLKELKITSCTKLRWSGFALPPSLQILSLCYCGDISTWVPSCLENLASLVTLKFKGCQRITSIPGNLWSTNLTSLENLLIFSCQDIESIGGENAISEIKNVLIDRCGKLEEIKQPMLKGSGVERS